jgi:hypothetical protein
MTIERQVRSLALVLALAGALGVAGPAPAQILSGGVPGLPAGGGLPGGLPGDLPTGLGNFPPLRTPRPVDVPASLTPLERIADELAGAPLTEVRRLTAERLLRAYPHLLEADDHGQPALRGEVLAVNVKPATLARLRQAGFGVRAQDDLGALGLTSVVLGLPKGQSTVEAVRTLRSIDPAGQYDFNHIYGQAGVATAASLAAGAGEHLPTAEGRGLRIGLVDGSAAESRPVLAHARLTQRAFGPGGARATAHATAVASLIVGTAGRFRGSAPGAALYVADVYGPTAAGGSAEAVVRGLAWLAEARTPVISISLVGPPNLLLHAAVEALIARGHLVVAAVGNDGPAAPPLYPAGYLGVVAVTGVDARQRVLPEAGRGTHVDFSAPGADLAAARAGGGFVGVRGTSFAAPIVAGRLARLLEAAASPAQAIEVLGREAVDLGAPGPDPVYGRGLVGGEVRVDPAAFGVSPRLIGENSPGPG